MSRQLRLDARALVELNSSALKYDTDNPGVGGMFLAAVADAIEAVAEWPGLGAPVAEVEGGVIRQFRVRRFPYHVGYLVTDEEIRVLAVAHERRQPGYWTSRQ